MAHPLCPVALVSVLSLTPALAEPAAPTARPQMGMMMKPVVCRALEEGKGKSGQALAEVIERESVRYALANYQLTAILPGDPPIVCYQARADLSKLPRGAR